MAMTSRELAVLATKSDFSIAANIDKVLLTTVVEAVSSYELSMTPVEAMPAQQARSAAKDLARALGPIGAKLAPSMTADQASAWADAVADSLSKWPPRVALAAIKAGIKEPYEFGIKSVDAKLHKLAAEIHDKHRAAIFRLRMMRDEIRRAGDATKRLEHKSDPPEPIKIDEVIAVFRAPGGESFVRMGLASGYLDHDIVEAARKAI